MSFGLLNDFLKTTIDERVEVMYSYLVKGESGVYIASTYYHNENYAWKISAITQGYGEKGGKNRGKVSATKEEIKSFVESHPDGTYQSGLTIGEFYSSLRQTITDDVFCLYNELENEVVTFAVQSYQINNIAYRNDLKCALMCFNKFGMPCVLAIYGDSMIISQVSGGKDLRTLKYVETINFKDVLNFSLDFGFYPEIWISTRKKIEKWSNYRGIKIEFRQLDHDKVESLYYQLTSLLEKWRNK